VWRIADSGEISNSPHHTGYAHAIQDSNGKAKFFEGAGDRRYRLMTEIGRLEHEEHGTIVLEAGWYEVRRQREYDPWEQGD
jgi:hypothetical protein